MEQKMSHGMQTTEKTDTGTKPPGVDLEIGKSGSERETGGTASRSVPADSEADGVAAKRADSSSTGSADGKGSKVTMEVLRRKLLKVQ